VRLEWDDAKNEANISKHGVSLELIRKWSAGMSDDIPELTEKELAGAIPVRVRKRLVQGRFESGEDVAALRRFVRLTQEQFARALGISVHTLRNWEQGRRVPEGPSLALLRIAAKHPRIIRESIESAA
jgi:putative transcriptional regulator